MKFTPLTASRTSAWRGPGAGVGTSTNSMLSGPPGSLACMIFMIAAYQQKQGSSDPVEAQLRFPAAARLDRVQLGIHTAFREQRFVGSAFDDSCVLDDEDDVGVPNRAEMVRDDDGRPALHQAFQGLRD